MNFKSIFYLFLFSRTIFFTSYYSVFRAKRSLKQAQCCIQVDLGQVLPAELKIYWALTWAGWASAYVYGAKTIPIRSP